MEQTTKNSFQRASTTSFTHGRPGPKLPPRHLRPGYKPEAEVVATPTTVWRAGDEAVMMQMTQRELDRQRASQEAQERINGLRKGSRLDLLHESLVGTVRVLWSLISYQPTVTFYFDLRNAMSYGRFSSGSFKFRVKRNDEACKVLPKPDMVWTGSDLDAARSSNFVLFVQAELGQDLQEILQGGPIDEMSLELFDRSFRVLSAHEAPALLGPVPAPQASEPPPVPASIPAPPPMIVAPDDHYSEFTV